MSEYAFCEPVWATTSSHEHIRLIPDSELPKLGGGISSPALCGFDLAHGWNIPTEVNERRVRRGLTAQCNPTCRRCAELWLMNHHADICTCGMAEQERTGHYPEHQDWCDVPSPLDDPAPTSPEVGRG